MLIPLRTDSPLRHTPYMNWALIAANVIVFAIMGFGGAHASAVAERFSLAPRQPLLYQFFTYQFLHAGWLHIAGNMLFLYIFGNNVNDRMGHLGYLAFYLAGGVCAGLGYVLTQAHDVPMVGASGAISAVTGAYLVLLPRSNITVVYWYFLIGTLEVPSLWFIAFFFLYDVILNFFFNDQGVAHSAHISGTTFGFLVCSALLVAHLLPRDHFDIVALAQRWNRRRQYRDMVTKGYNPFEYTQSAKASLDRNGRGSIAAPSPPPPDPATQRVLEVRSQIADAVAMHDLDRAAQLYVELKTLDPQQVLSRSSQLDVANHLAHQQLYPQAVEAYELFLCHYPKTEQTDRVELMLGLIYARYLEIALAREELARIERQIAKPPTT
jgi:membrane associated rhomboid family serine protease